MFQSFAHHPAPHWNGVTRPWRTGLTGDRIGLPQMNGLYRKIQWRWLDMDDLGVASWLWKPPFNTLQNIVWSSGCWCKRHLGLPDSHPINPACSKGREKLTGLHCTILFFTNCAIHAMPPQPVNDGTIIDPQTQPICSRRLWLSSSYKNGWEQHILCIEHE